MFWRMTGLSTASPVESILDKENYTLEELLDEDEIIQECKALNTRLINYLRDRAQVEQLLHYIVEEASEDTETKRTFKFPFVACEIFTCEVDVILKTIVEDEELLNLLFSFLKPDHLHSTLLAGYFSKVVICLMLRMTAPLMNYLQGHQEIFRQLVDLIGITSIMEVLIRLIGADESMHSNYVDAIQWLEGTDVLEMIVDKFSSSDAPEVHANAAEILCAIIRYAPPGFAAKICSPSLVGRLFRHALEGSRPKSVLVHSISVCISLLDPKRLVSASYHLFQSQLTRGSLVTANPESVDGMLESLGDLLKLLDVSSAESILPTTYGNLQPPFGMHRLKIVEFISVLLSIGSEAAEKKLVQLGAIRHILDLFFEYPFNNFLHHHVENIIGSCLESKSALLIEHLLQDCDIVGKILGAEKQPLLSTNCSKPTTVTQGRSLPRIGNVGHMTRIADKLIQLGNTNSIIRTHLQEYNGWVDWHANVLLKRNAIENVYQWACGRPTALQDRIRDSDDEDFRDRDYDVAALASNLSQAIRYGIYTNEGIEEAHGSLERDDEAVYFDNESAEVVISSLRLGDDQDSSLFTNSNWFALEEDRVGNASPSPSSDQTDEVIAGVNEDLTDSATSLQVPDPNNPNTNSEESGGSWVLENGPIKESGVTIHSSPLNIGETPPEWVEWRETSDSGEVPHSNPTLATSNSKLKADKDVQTIDETSIGADTEDCNDDAGGLPGPCSADAKLMPICDDGNPCAGPSEEPEPINVDSDPNAKISSNENAEIVVTRVVIEDAEHEKNAVENEAG